MKKILSTAFVLLALLAMTAGTAFAGSALELVSVSNNSAGPTFTFRVTGEFSQEELQNGFVSVEGGEDFPLYCAQQDEDTVVCHTSKKISDHNVVVGFGGARFWTKMPEPAPLRGCEFGNGAHYYPVYSGNEKLTGWVQWTEICMDSVPAEMYGYYIPGDPNFWGIFYEFSAGSNLTPGDLGFIFGLPYIDPGFYQ